MSNQIEAVNNLRSMSEEALAQHLREQRTALFRARLRQTIGQMENHREVRALRHEIARAMTVQAELSRGEVHEIVPQTTRSAVAVEEKPKRSRRTAAAETAAAPDEAAAAAVEKPAAAEEPDESEETTAEVAETTGEAVEETEPVGEDEE